MSKELALRIIRLLSGIESVLMSKERIPDYLFEEISSVCEVLEQVILGK